MGVYDDEHDAAEADAITPLDLLKGLLDDHGMTTSDLGRLLCDRTIGSKILRGDRQVSKAHARILGEHFKLDPGCSSCGKTRLNHALKPTDEPSRGVASDSVGPPVRTQ